MKFCTQAGCTIAAYFPDKIEQVASTQLFQSRTGKLMRRITFTFAIFLIAFLQMALAQGPVTGRVTDDNSQPLPGVSVSVKGTSNGVTTNNDGRFSIVVSNSNDTLVLSFVGFSSQELAVGGRSSINVTLSSDSKTLSDVVVVGYGRQKKVNLVGAVSAINVDEKLTSRALPNVSAGLTGLVPGLTAVQSSGMAGRNGATLLIRGLGTVNNSGPLVVVDGMPDIDINTININDIETISILKDATSASVYGSRAANGVILITTKSGKGMKRTAINFTSNTSVTVPTQSFDFMADYSRALTLHQRRAATNTLQANQLFKNGTIDQWMALGMIDPLRYPNTDWWDIILRNGTFENYNLSASGGNDVSNFFVSVGVRDEEGLQINNDYKQYNARFNFDYKIKKNMNTGIKFFGTSSKFVYALEEGFTDSDPANTAGTDMQYAIAGITPYDPASGKFGGVMSYGEDPQAYNPYTLYVNSLTRQNRQIANASLYWDWTPVKGLTAGIEYALNYYNQFRWQSNIPNQSFNFQTNAFGSRVYVGPNAPIVNATNTGYKTLLTGRLNYHTTIADNHDINALVVYSEEYWYDRFQASSRNDRLHPSLSEIDAALTDIQSTGGNSNGEGLRSYIGRINYTAFSKYLLEANLRVDGSSKFLEGNQYGYFPSIGLGWRFTEENFIKNVAGFLSNGKLRLSYGSLGNNSGIGRYEQQSTLAANHYFTVSGISRGLVNNKIINRDLSWETTTVLNIGLEFGFFNNRLTTEFDFYDRLTTGMNRPSDMSILLTGAYVAPRKNIGNMRNRGFEGNIAWRDRVGKISYGVNLNASYNATRLEKWNEFIGRGSTTTISNIAYNIFLDMPYNFVYTYEDIGVAQTWQDIYDATPQDARPGDILRKDLNGDGRIDGNDRKAYTNLQRDRFSTNFALNGFVNWRGFDIAFMFQGATGRKDYYLNAFNQVNFSAQRYASTWGHWENPWSLDNRTGDWPRLGGIGANQEQTTLWLDNMRFVRIKNLQLGYSFPGKFLQRFHIYNLRIAGSAENLATFTSYRGLDPEKAVSNNNLYPINKSYSLAIQLGF